MITYWKATGLQKEHVTTFQLEILVSWCKPLESPLTHMKMLIIVIQYTAFSHTQMREMIFSSPSLCVTRPVTSRLISTPNMYLLIRKTSRRLRSKHRTFKWTMLFTSVEGCTEIYRNERPKLTKGSR